MLTKSLELHIKKEAGPGHPKKWQVQQINDAW